MTIALIIIGILLILLAGLIVFIVLKGKKKKIINKRLELIREKLDKDSINRHNAEITRVEKIVRVNPKYQEEFDEMLKQHIIIEKKTKWIDDQIKNIYLNAKSMGKKDLDFKIQFLDNKVSKLVVKREKIKSMIKSLTYQDNFLKNEFNQYAIILREIIASYRNRRLLLQSISPKIDDFLKDIHDVSTKITIKINQADNVGATKLFSKYSFMVNKLAHIIDEGPAIQTYIMTTIPRHSKELFELYQKKKKALGELSHINFKPSINKMALDFRNVRDLFQKLDIEGAKKKLVKIIHSIKFLERLINFEIRSRAFVYKNYKGIITETKHNLRDYVSLRKEIKLMSKSGKKLSVDFINAYEKMVQDAEELDKKSVIYKENMKRLDIPNSAKLISTKTIINANKTLINSLNEMYSQIYLSNIEKSIAVNKYKRLEAALNSIVANSKTNNIKRTIEELKEHKRIMDRMQKISRKLSRETIGKETMKELSSIEILVADYYKALAGKIELAIMINNLFIEYAHERALNNSLNASFNIAEKEYLQGNYAASLNQILSTLEREK